MGRVYSVHASIISITTAKTLLQVKAGATTPLRLIRAWCTNGTTETDDTMEIQILRKSAAATVTSFTPILLSPGSGAAAAVGGASATGHTATAEGTDGDILIREGSSILAGWTHLPVPEERIEVGPGGILALKSAITVASMTMICGMTFEELF